MHCTYQDEYKQYSQLKNSVKWILLILQRKQAKQARGNMLLQCPGLPKIRRDFAIAILKEHIRNSQQNFVYGLFYGTLN